MLRSIGSWAAVGAVVALCVATPASARPGGLAQTVGTAHVLVHYDSATLRDADARTLADAAERAYGLEVGQWGFRPPLDDEGLGGDGRVDVYAVAPGGGNSEGGLAVTDDELGTGAGHIELNPRFAARGAFVAHELFHLVQFGYDTEDALFLYEATAELAAANTFPGADLSDPLFLKLPGAPLDCPPGSCGQDTAGYGQWPFFQYALERLGPAAIRGIWERVGSGEGGRPRALAAIAGSFAAAGSSLADVWNGYVRANLLPSSYGNSFLRALGKRMPAAKAAALAPRAGASARATASVPHLAAQYFLFRASSCTKKAARPLRLAITVTLPEGSGAVPSVRVDGARGAPQVSSLAVSGGTATATVPFAPCSSVLLGLPNGTLRDGAAFSVALAVR